jgi:transposase
MVAETIAPEENSFGGDHPDRPSAGIGPELRTWVRHAEIDTGSRAGTTSAERERIAALEREVRELRRAKDILKSASIFFAGELDPRPRR